MLLLDDGALVYSATDMAQAATCEFALLRTLDAKLGLSPALEREVDATRERAGRLGDVHEQRVLAELLQTYGTFDGVDRGVLSIERPARSTRQTLTDKHAETIAALSTGADVVFQAGFFDGRFAGWADFLIRADDRTAAPARYSVHDTKLARHERPTALLQLAAYADQLLAAGIGVDEHVHLILGNRVVTTHRVADLLPVYRERRARLQALLDAHREAGVPVVWGAPGHRACGRCDVCAPELEARRDVLLVAGMRASTRAKLQAAGVATVEDLAARAEPVDGISAGAYAKLRAQATMQARQDSAPRRQDGTHEVTFEMFAPDAIAQLPAPSAGDIFFDFEGDPLWSAGEVDLNGQAATWGLEYLFGVVEAPAGADEPVFRPFWAHDRAQEKQALVDFLAYVQARRAQHPDMHIYHYAAYEKTALLRLAARHGVGEDVIDDLLRAGVLVDLLATVRASVRVGQRSYSLKKLEPLYMDDARSGEVTTAGDSINEYALACSLRAAGDEDGWNQALDSIGDYNRYDCVSTLKLRDWLLAQAAVAGVTPGRASGGAADGDGEQEMAPEHDPLVTRLLAFADDEAQFTDGARTRDQHAVALVAASLGYHWREHKPFWWAHFDRLSADPAQWTDARSTMLIDEVEVVDDWHTPPRARTLSRTLKLTGRLEPGSDIRAGASCYALYDPPVPACATTSEGNPRGWSTGITVTGVDAEARGSDVVDVVTVTDKIRQADDPHALLPMALTPSAPPSTATIAAALRQLAEKVAADLPTLPQQAGVDLLRRITPRTRSGQPLPVPGDEPQAMVEAITAALRDLDGSYLAVQGPPGTGKTYTGSHVIADLVASGWKVAVVAQSHAVVENLLTKVIDAGVPPTAVAKKPKTKPDPDLTWVQPKDTAAFGAFYATQPGGFVVGGTVWDFTNDDRITPGGFDLIVVDEAGQFSLANTLAVSAAARNLLLLGDPQQLPQVAQGNHPEPVDVSALEWLTDGHDTMPAELGYFLAHTWRMHPDLCARVSALSYEGRLQSVPEAGDRHLDGLAAGVHAVEVDHQGNSVSSVEEAAEVVRRIRALVGRTWTDHDGSRPLEAGDVLVVAAYNAQVWTVRRALEAAGLDAVRVGTVDKFQGQEAPVVIVTTAASSSEDVPRGMEFLLNRNRLNVAISRGKWAAIIVRATGLTDYLPSKPAAMAELGAFIGVCSQPIHLN